MSITFLRRASLHRILPSSLPHPLLITSQHEDDANSSITHNSRIHIHELQTRRRYHATPKREIVPLIIIGVAGIGIYTYRALKQMDEDWEEYHDKLEEYQRVTGIIDPTASDDDNDAKTWNEMKITLFQGGTLAMDVGTSRLKLSHYLPSARSSSANNRPIVTVDREGARSTPSLIWMSTHNDGDGLTGRMAESRLYNGKGGRVFRSRDVINNNFDDSAKEVVGNNEAVALSLVRQSIRMAASNALDQVLGGGGVQQDSSSQSTSSSSPLFVIDKTMAYSGSYNVRPVFTHPTCTTSSKDHDGDAFLTTYKSVIRELTSPEGIGLFVPEAIAAVTGAEYYNLLPSSSTNNQDPVLVVDVGGNTTYISIVSSNKKEKEVLYSASIPFGGDTFIDLLTDHLIRDFYGTTNSSGSSHENGISTTPSLDDPSALQRIYEASATALHELSNKSRSQINIPYLSIDLQTRQPKHLEVGVPRSIVDKEVETFVRDRLVNYLLASDGNGSIPSLLSASLPKPTDLATLFSSVLASAMEQVSLTPFSLRAVLLVGGGSRIPLVRDSMKRGAGQVGGDMFTERLVMPEGELAEELVVLGAALSK